jgi:hypothetical protein
MMWIEAPALPVNGNSPLLAATAPVVDSTRKVVWAPRHSSASQKQQFIAAGLPIISIDTKKKELIGDFRNKGRTWRRQAEEVNEHDFPGAAKCRVVPFGIYDPTKNKGCVFVGLSNDTPQFAVCSIARSWKRTRPR